MKEKALDSRKYKLKEKTERALLQLGVYRKEDERVFPRHFIGTTPRDSIPSLSDREGGKKSWWNGLSPSSSRFFFFFLVRRPCRRLFKFLFFFFVRAFLYVSWEEERSDWLRDRSPQRTTKTTTGKAYVWPPVWPKIKFIITIFSPFTNEMDRALCSFSPTWWLSLKRWLVQWNQIGIDEMELTKEGGGEKIKEKRKRRKSVATSNRENARDRRGMHERGRKTALIIIRALLNGSARRAI